MCKKATRSSLAMEAERCCLADPVRCKQGKYVEAVGEELQRQSVMLASAIKDVLDAVSKNKGRRCLVRRKTDLETALESYERACVSLQQVADPDNCAAATKARRTLVDSSDEALDQLETLIEVKTEEKVTTTEVKLQEDEQEEIGAKVDLAEFGVVEQLAEEDKLVEKFGIKEVEEPRIDKVKVERLDVVKVEKFGAKPLVDPGEQAAEAEFGAAKDELQEHCIPESNHEKEFANQDKVLGDGQLDPGERDAKDWQKAMKELKVEVRQGPSKVMRRRFSKLLGLISRDAKLALQVSALRRFVDWVLNSNCEYG